MAVAVNPEPTASLRAALLFALGVARQGERDDPPVAAPARLRPYLGFAKVPGAALEVCRRVVDDDEAFRRRVATAATADEVGAIGFLWLTRPDNWELSAAALQAERERDRRHDADARRHDDLERREALAREAARAAERERREAVEALDANRAELTGERRRVRALEAEVQALEAKLAEEQARSRQLLRRLKDTEAALSKRTAENRSLRNELERLRADDRQAVPVPATADPAEPDPPLTAEVAAERARAGAELRAAVDAARDAAAMLGDALARASSALDGDGHRAGAAPAASSPSHRPVPVARPAAGPARPIRSRQPVRIPAGMFEESVAAARHLVGLPGVVLLVDGYNVAKTGWPALDLPRQRDRLVDAVGNLRAATGARSDIVFDGVDDAVPRARSAPVWVRVEFTPAGVEADDRLLELVDQVPAGLPVVVVSDDRRVRDGARARGANVLGAEQLLALLR